MKKKIFALVLACILTMGVLPSFAADEDYPPICSPAPQPIDFPIMETVEK